MEKYCQKLLSGEIYHIYNRAIGNELMFKTEKDYYFFLKKIQRFILPVSKIYCYCLMPNHFHLLVRMKKTHKGLETGYNKTFSNFFNSYAKSYNNAHNRKGKLFMLPFKRVQVEDEEYFNTLVLYIHRNPIHHGFVKNYTSWKYSSYKSFIDEDRTIIEYDEVISWFDGIADFIDFHKTNKDFSRSGKYEIE